MDLPRQPQRLPTFLFVRGPGGDGPYSIGYQGSELSQQDVGPCENRWCCWSPRGQGIHNASCRGNLVFKLAFGLQHVALTACCPLPSHPAVPALYGRDKGWCMIPGHRTADCPVNATYDGMYWPQESVHLEETRWCSTEKVVKSWQQTAKGMKAVWGEQKFQGTCCHYPATAEVWEARYVQVNIYDEDNWNSNDLLGSVEVDLRRPGQDGFTKELSELAHFQSVDHDYDVQELNVKGRPNGDLFTVKVRVAWEHPTEHAVSTVFDTKPLDWDPYGVSLSSANAPWETHGFSPPPPFHCDCSWTATWSCPDDEKGSEGFAKPDGSKCFEYCCPPEVYGELAAERTADVSHHMASVASAWVAFPIILVIALIVVVMRFGMRARDAQAQGLPSTGPITANML